MITENKTRKIIFLTLTISCLIAAAVCFICDFAINRQIIWSGYPFVSLIYAWIIISPPLVARKHGIISFLTALTVATIPFLYFIDYFSPGREWFLELGVPCAITGIAAMWITYFYVRFFKTGIWYRLSAFTFLYGVVASTVIQYFTDSFTGDNFLRLGNFIEFAICVAVTVLLAVVGYYKTNKSGAIVK